MGSPSNQHSLRHNMAVSVHPDASRSRNSESTTQGKMNTSKSNSDLAHSAAKHGKVLSKKKLSKSFHCARERDVPTVSKSFHCARERGVPSDRHCAVHPNIRLGGGEDDTCPKCAIQLMKLAAKTLERRAAELELERKDKKAEEKANRAKRKERKLVSSSSKKSSDEIGQGREEDINALLRWSTDFEYCSSQRSSKINPPSPRKTKSKSSPPRPRLVRQFSIGQIAQPAEIDEPSSRADTLIKIARLKEGDGAWVKRSDDMWTYATLKARENGPDAMLVFTVSGRGGVKKFPVTHWHKYVRIVAEKSIDNVDLEEEDDDAIDMMMSDRQLQNESNGGEKRKVKEEDHVLEKSLDTFGSEATTPMSNKVFSSGEIDEEEASRENEPFTRESDEEEDEPVGFDVSMYTLGLGDNVFSQDHRVPMHTSGFEDDTSLQDHDVSMYCLGEQDHSTLPILQDHDVSMYCLGEQDHSTPPILEYGPESEEEKPKEAVPFKTPQDKAPESFKSSMTSIASVDYDADAEETAGGKDKPAGKGKAKEITHRSSSLPLPQAHAIREQEQKNRAPKCRTSRLPNSHHRVSWSNEIDEIKKEIYANIKKPKPTVSDPAPQKKRLNELNMGKAITKNRGLVRQNSFYSALKSIHRRESVMMPPTSSVAVNPN